MLSTSSCTHLTSSLLHPLFHEWRGLAVILHFRSDAQRTYGSFCAMLGSAQACPNMENGHDRSQMADAGDQQKVQQKGSVYVDSWM